MIIRRADTRSFSIPNCHGGSGAVTCREILGDYNRTTPGLTLVHDNILAPGVSIGEHEHRGDEEVYFVLEGCGEMVVNGVRESVGPGDVCITREGDRHSLINTGESDLRLLVVAANTVRRGVQ